MPRKLRVEYRTKASFRREYAQNIAKGGIFVPTRQPVELREHVELELVLAFADESIALPGEVVHCVPPEMASSGAEPGVALQFLMDGEELRGKLQAWTGPVATDVDEREQETGRRVAPRFRAHVPARVELDGEVVDAWTRNISRSGALIALPDDPPPLGRRLKIQIRLPGGRDQMKVAGQVTRHLRTSALDCVGVQFQVPEARMVDVDAFVGRVRAVEHTRRLGGINGPIADLGIRGVLAMFGASTPEGMLTLLREDLEGYILMDHGQLRAQLGLLKGRPALEAMLDWSEGSFAFEGQVDETLIAGETIPLGEVVDVPAGAGAGSRAGAAPATDPGDDDLVLMDIDDVDPPGEPDPDPEWEPEWDDVDETPASAAPPPRDDGFVPDDDHSLGEFVIDDEEADAIEARLQMDTAPIVTPDAHLVAVEGMDRSSLGTVEEAILDLAAVGMTVAKAVEIIPEPDEQVYAAIEKLVDDGFLDLE